MNANFKVPKKTPFKTAVSHILILLLILFSVLLLLNQRPFKSQRIPQYQGNHNYQEPSWVLKEDGKILDPAVKLPSFMPLKTGAHYSISATLTYDGSQDRVPFGFFYIHHMYCKAYLNGQELFSYMPEDVRKLDRSKSPGNVYVSFPMPEDCLGKEFTIEFMPPLSIDMEYELPFPVFGDYPTEAFHTFLGDLPHNITAMLSGFLGIASVIFASIILKDSEYREGIFIGVFAIVFSIYNITECNFNFYVISNPYYTYVINYISFTLIPIFLIGFLRERMNPPQKPVGTYMMMFDIFLLAAELLLHFVGIIDMREFLPILHIAYFTELIIIFVLLIKMKQNRWKQQLFLQMIPILIGMVLDAAIYYKHWTLSKSDAAFTTVGMVLFLIVELYHVWTYSIDIYTESVRSQEYQKMAYIDALTGIGNRRAFETEKEKIQCGQITYQSLRIASVDVNFLKATNDTQGHAAGDFLIRNAANVLSELAQGYGDAFRVGGDEFIVLLYNLDDKDFSEKIQAMEENIRSVNGNSEVKLSLAVGWEKTESTNIESSITAADKKMYDNKSKIKGNRIHFIAE